jgi:hypothetical protein
MITLNLRFYNKGLATLNMPPLTFADATLPGRVSRIFGLTYLLNCQGQVQLRQLPANRDQTDNQLLGSLAGKVITILTPTLARRSRSAVSARCNPNTDKSALRHKIGELTFWASVHSGPVPFCKRLQPNPVVPIDSMPTHPRGSISDFRNGEAQKEWVRQVATQSRADGVGCSSGPYLSE